MGRSVCVALLFVAGVACSGKEKRDSPGQAADVPGKCLPLPSVVRRELTLAPNGRALYWLDSSREYNYDANLEPITRLMRFDLQTRQLHVVADHIAEPIQFLGDKLLALRVAEDYRLLTIEPDGHIQELSPSYLDVVDVEIVDPRTLVFLADGNGERALFVLDLDAPRPRHLMDADVLLSTANGRVFARVDEEGFSIDPKTGERHTFAVLRKAVPNRGDALFIDRKRVQLQQMGSGETRTLIDMPGEWDLQYQIGTVLARTPPRDDKSHAYLIHDGKTTRLPTLIGGTSILEAVTDGKQTWALVGHNSNNYSGDLAKTDAESEVCLLPDALDFTMKTRRVPARYHNKEDKLFEAIAKIPDATVQVMDFRNDPTTVSIELKHEEAVRDFTVMRTRVRELHNLVTSILGEREVATEIHFTDHRKAVYRWHRDWLAYHTLAGMGDALLSDPADFDVDVSDLTNESEDGKITCSGTLRALHKPLTNVDLKCSGNREHVIHIGELRPGTPKKFSETFEVSDLGEAAYIEIFADKKLVLHRDMTDEARTERTFDVATTVYAATQLWLDRHRVDKTIRVDLRGTASFLRQSKDAQEAAIAKAYDGYTALRGIYHADDKSEIEVHVEIELSDVTFTYDGSRLTRDD